MVAGGCYSNGKVKLEGIVLILITMNRFLESGPILLIIVAAVGTTIILGLLLRLLGSYSEISKLRRFGLLILLTIGVGFTVFTLALAPAWSYALAIAGIIIVCIGFPLLWCRNKK